MTAAQLRAAFWAMLRETSPRLYAQRRVTTDGRRVRLAPQNSQPCDIRAAWVDYVDSMARGGAISERVAQQVAL